MSDSPSGQSAEHWKQKYYDHLDHLEQKEQEWSSLETVLKRAIGRLSLAAEGHSPSLDRHIRDIRNAVKDRINRQKLDVILDDLSELLTKLEEKTTDTDRQRVALMQQLLEGLSFSGREEKNRSKLLKRLSRADDDSSAELLGELLTLIKTSLAVQDTRDEPRKAGLLDRLLKPADNGGAESVDYQHTAQCLMSLLRAFPWPAERSAEIGAITERLTQITDGQQLDRLVNDACRLAGELSWPTPVGSAASAVPDRPALDQRRTWLLDLADAVDDPASPNGRLAAMRALMREAEQMPQLDQLGQDLYRLLKLSSSELGERAEQPAPAIGAVPVQPSIQELLIRLLEQLLVPPDLVPDVDHMKSRLESETSSDNWKQLLEDVAALINSIRSRLQQEKHEFEDFLQQITGRLKELDEFLRLESNSIQDAEKQGEAFDRKLHSEVQVIRDDVVQATDLSHLKKFVESRLDVISQHIHEYRDQEKSRLVDAQHNFEQMQTKMVSLEQETQALKKVIVEKNKQAMFDVLTGIHNRFAYEKKIAEEVARWKRFGHPLSLAIWDVDYFKKVNDTFGHKAGDKVLRTIAQLLNDRIRATDFLARYGGEEFVMLLPGTKEEETLRLVNDLREKVAACGFHYHGDPVSITVSCGVSSFRDNDELEQVFERADKALYRAKRTGRNKCVIASARSD